MEGDMLYLILRERDDTSYDWRLELYCSVLKGDISSLIRRGKGCTS